MPWRKGNRLTFVSESSASPEVREVFDAVKAALGVNYVPLCLQAFASYPDFLKLQWITLYPLLGTREFFDLAARLRAEAYTYVHNYFKVPPLGDANSLLHAPGAVDQLAYVESAMLLLLSAQMQAFEGILGRESACRPAARPLNGIGPEFTNPETAPVAVRRLLDDVRHSVDLPYVGDAERALACWPELLASYWKVLKPAVQTLFYERSVFELRESALRFAVQIPLSVNLEIAHLLDEGIDESVVSAVTRLTDVLNRGSAISLLNLTFAKIALEGGNLGEQSPPEFSSERVA